jgi:hypothetical protein
MSPLRRQYTEIISMNLLMDAPDQSCTLPNRASLFWIISTAAVTCCRPRDNRKFCFTATHSVCPNYMSNLNHKGWENAQKNVIRELALTVCTHAFSREADYTKSYSHRAVGYTGTMHTRDRQDRYSLLQDKCSAKGGSQEQGPSLLKNMTTHRETPEHGDESSETKSSVMLLQRHLGAERQRKSTEHTLPSPPNSKRNQSKF